MKHRQLEFFSKENNNNVEQLEVNFLKDLRPEMIKEILGHLSPKELCGIAMVSKKLKDLSEDDMLWDKFLKQEPYSAYQSIIENLRDQKHSSKKIFLTLMKLTKNENYASALKQQSKNFAVDLSPLEKEIPANLSSHSDLIGLSPEEINTIKNEFMSRARNTMDNLKQIFGSTLLKDYENSLTKDHATKLSK